MERDDARAVVAEFFPAHQAGDRDASDKLVTVVHRELRRLAEERVASGGEEGPASLPNLYAEIVGDAGLPPDERAPFLLICARSMRRAVVEHMRTPAGQADPRGALILAVHDLLEAIERFNPRMVRTVEALYFAALPEDQAGLALRVDPAVLRRDWKRARTWLVKELPSYAPGAAHREVSVANAAWVDAVFDDALALSAEQRAAFLDRCSSVSPNLRRDVDELLRLSDHPLPGFEPRGLRQEALWAILAGMTPVPPTAAPGDPDEALSSFRESDARPDQRSGLMPANELKWLPDGPAPSDVSSVEDTNHHAPALTDDDPALRALLRLKHPNIARVLDAGRGEDGRAFLLLERVEGRPIDRYCDEELLTVDERLDLFLHVCSAVQYGHRRLVAHGAIEPSTVLVTDAREVKLLDYGASGLMRDAATRGGDGHSISAYSSPEQVQGEPIAVASDVYQLGLLLYELLTGEQAHDIAGRSRDARERAICTEPVVRPSVRVSESPDKYAAARRLRPRALARLLRGDLDAIVMYALRKEPERRYPSVSALRSDVQRYRSRLPIWIRSDSLAYRAQRFLARRRMPLAAALALVAVAAVLLPDPVQQRLRATQETERAAQVERLLGDMLSPGDGASGAQPPSPVHFVDAAARIARAELAREPRGRARVLTAAGRAYTALGHHDRAVETLEDALAVRRTHFGDDSLEVAETLEALAVSEHLMGRYDESEASFRNVLAVRQVRAGAGHPLTTGTSIALGDLLHTRGQLLEAEQMLRAAVASLRPEIRMAGSDAPVNTLLPRALEALASVLRDRGVPAEASALYREAITMLKQPDGNGGPALALARIEFAELLVSRGDLERADAELAEAIPALRRAYPGEHPDIALGLRSLAQLRMDQGRFDEAGALLAEGRRLQEQSLGRIHPLVTRTVALQAELARRRGQIPESIAGARQALDDYERLGLQLHQHTIDARLTLGEALIASGDHQEAVRVLASGLAAAEQLLVTFDPRIKRLQDAMTRAARASVPGGGAVHSG